MAFSDPYAMSEQQRRALEEMRRLAESQVRAKYDECSQQMRYTPILSAGPSPSYDLPRTSRSDTLKLLLL